MWERKLVLTDVKFIFWVQFFTTEPYACEPSSLPKYPPSKEMDVKLRDEEARRLIFLSFIMFTYHGLVFAVC